MEMTPLVPIIKINHRAAPISRLCHPVRKSVKPKNMQASIVNPTVVRWVRHPSALPPETRNTARVAKMTPVTRFQELGSRPTKTEQNPTITTLIPSAEE